MKIKLLAALAFIPMLTDLTKCGNMNLTQGNFSYYAVHISTPTGNVDVSIKDWKDEKIGVEVTTEDYGSIFLSEGTYILISELGKCPVCDNVKN